MTCFVCGYTVQAVFRQLKGLVDALETHQARGSTAVLDLEAVPGLPLIPTLNGRVSRAA